MILDLNKSIGDSLTDPTNRITYNHLNLPERVQKSPTEYIVYTYDATGRKLKQVALQNGVTKTTDYAGEFIYEDNVLQFIQHEEGRIVMTGAKPEYQYHLKDHLGNVRLTFTTKEETESFTATLEPTNAAEEQARFLRLETARKVYSPLFDRTNGSSLGYAQRLNGTANERYGIARSISVMPGDVVKAEVYAKYVDQNTGNQTPELAGFLASLATGTVAPLGKVVDGAGYASSTSSFSYAGLLNKSESSGTGPKAYLNWIIFDKDYNYITGGYKRMSDIAKEQGQNVAHEKLSADLPPITEPGYVYIYLSNEETTPIEVFFDDFTVQSMPGRVVQMDDYYPFGLTFNSYTRENVVDQSNLYQGKERQDELNLGTYDFHARMYDPTIGRTFQLDPLGEKYYDFSSYSWAANNPLRFMDPTGMEIEDGSRREWDRQRNSVEGRRDKLQAKADKLNAKAEAKGWSAEKLASKMGNLTERIGSLNTSLATMGTLEASTQVYSLSKTAAGENGGVTLNTATNVIDIKFGSTANFVHESTHAGQFETGDIAFDGNTGMVLGQDIGDEVAGYRAQFAYDPSSVSGLPSTAGTANSFGTITNQWVQGLAGGTLYNPGGSANTGASHIDINSTKADFIRAYPTNPGAMNALPNNFTLRTGYPNIYYKR